MSTSFIIYATNIKYLDKTIDGIIDNTNNDLIFEIIVCNDGCQPYSRDNVKIINSENIGRAKAWNNAFLLSNGSTIVFLKESIKFGIDWLIPILEILNEEPQSLVSPIVHVLDSSLWSSEPNCWKRFGLRWDLELYNRQYVNRSNSPAISSACIAVNRQWFSEVGMFDNGMVVGSGEDIELSIRNWLLGGYIFIADNSTVSCTHEIDVGSGTISNQSRIAEVWFKKYANYFYNIKNIKPTEIDTGRLSNLILLREKQQRTFEWYLSNHLPELYEIYSLKNSAIKKRIAIIAPGASLDYIDNGYINSFDILIGVDYIGKLFACDYVITDSVSVITELRSIYHAKKFVLPMAIENRVIGEYIATNEIIPESYQFEHTISNVLPISVDPPFCNFGSITMSAVHFAMFLNPASITLIGCDNKLIGEKSHTSKIEYYDDGIIWSDSESTRRMFAHYEYCLDYLGKLSHSLNIPLIRVSHA